MSDYDKCPNCGSTDLFLLDEKINQYKCQSCLNVFQLNVTNSQSSENQEKPKSRVFFQKMMKKVVELHAYFENDIFSGTGFFISKEYILTNTHLIMLGEGNYAISVIGNDFEKKNRYIFNVVSADLKSDIAILKVTEGKSESVSFANNIYAGEKVYAISNSNGEGLVILEGIVSHTSKKINSRELFMTSFLSSEGASGCPVFNTNGFLLGMITKESRNSISMMHAIPSRVLLDYIKSTEGKNSIKII